MGGGGTQCWIKLLPVLCVIACCLYFFQERLFSLRVIYDLTFFLGVIVIIFQNLIFGVIIDTFADLRAEKNRKEEQLKNNCFICGACVCEGERKRVCVRTHVCI